MKVTSVTSSNEDRRPVARDLRACARSISLWETAHTPGVAGVRTEPTGRGEPAAVEVYGAASGDMLVVVIGKNMK